MKRSPEQKHLCMKGLRKSKAETTSFGTKRPPKCDIGTIAISACTIFFPPGTAELPKEVNPSYRAREPFVQLHESRYKGYLVRYSSGMAGISVYAISFLGYCVHLSCAVLTLEERLLVEEIGGKKGITALRIKQPSSA
jgi:hypothetical protein